MNDRSAPHDDLRVEALIDGISPGDPLGNQVERLLDERDGPVPVDERDLARAVASLQARIREGSATPGATAAPRARRGWSLPLGLLAAAAALVVAGAWWSAGTDVSEPIAAPDAAVIAEADPTAVGIRDGSIVDVRGDTVVVVDGVVSVARHDPDQPGAHRVLLAALDIAVEPIGTVYYAGSRGDLGAVWVQEGRVRLMHGREGHLGEVAAGSWALLSRNGESIEVRRVADGPFDPAELGADAAAAQLLADMRWMALPIETRAPILRDGE